MTRKAPKYSFVSNLKKIQKELEEAATDTRLKLAKKIHTRMKQNISSTGDPSLPGEFPTRQTGNLFKGLVLRHDVETGEQNKIASAIGFRGPAYHAHLVEFGKYKSPFFRRTFDEMQPEIAATFAEEKYLG